MRETKMPSTVRKKFSSQAAPEVLETLRQIARSQGRQFQTVLDEALRDYIEHQQKARPRRKVLEALASSLDEYDRLYRELAHKSLTDFILDAAYQAAEQTLLDQRLLMVTGGQYHSILEMLDRPESDNPGLTDLFSRAPVWADK